MPNRSGQAYGLTALSPIIRDTGRTPAHVAAFASEDDALRALAAAGADLNALEGQAYDVVTIAAVAEGAVPAPSVSPARCSR